MIIDIKGKGTNVSYVIKMAQYDDESYQIILVKKLEHIYKRLNAICVNQEVFLRCPDWKSLFVKIGNINYLLSRLEYDKLNKAVNNYLSYGKELQLALPIALFDSIDSNTGKITKPGVTILDFVQNTISADPYKEWKDRIKPEFYLLF